MKKSMALNLSFLRDEQIRDVFKILLLNDEIVDNQTATELQQGIYDKDNPYLRYYKHLEEYEWIVLPEIENGFLISYENFIIYFNDRKKY